MSRRFKRYYRKYRKAEDPVEGLAGLLGLVSMYLWFTDKTQFYIYVSVIALIFVIVIWVVIKMKKQRFNDVYSWHSDAEFLERLRSMHPNEFEDYISDMYSRLGYNAEQVGGAYDGGIDVIATKDGIKHYIQCKKYITSKVGVSEVRDFYGAMAGKLANGRGIFITTNIFTTEAEKFAEDKPIELIDGNDLIKLIKLTKKDGEAVVSAVPAPIEIKKCPKCGGDLIERVGKYGKFFGCSNYPKCTHTEKIQTVSNL